MHRRLRRSATRVATAWVMAGACALAQAQSVNLSGMMGNKALLVVDGNAPKLVAPGETYRGVRVVSTLGQSAVLDIAGQRQTLRMGDAPISVGQPVPAGTGARIVLSADSGGHFVIQGLLNSKPVQFMVDTGATAIGVSVSDADRIGLKYKQGQLIKVETANGTVPGWKVRLASVRMNDVEVREVDAVVTLISMP
ncbi:MAG TPA: TIGR02281 family clan AA aspartic protease, partial [Burkholderiaceae bacterium]|nr:TIGR02281 family clan AA aspartic protease [Burkholderiaceae bacterium]